MVRRILMMTALTAGAVTQASAQSASTMTTTPYNDYRGEISAIGHRGTQATSPGVSVMSLQVGKMSIFWPNELKDQRLIIRVADTLDGLTKNRAGLEVPGSPPELIIEGLKPGGRYFFDVLTKDGRPISMGISALVLDRPLSVQSAQTNPNGDGSSPSATPTQSDSRGANMADFMSPPKSSR